MRLLPRRRLRPPRQLRRDLGTPIRRLTAALLAVLVMIGIAGCSSSSVPSTASTPTPSSAGADAAGPGALARFDDQTLDWHACDAKFQCAELTVPEDYAKPGGRTLRIAVVRYIAAGVHPSASLIVNPGGPGGSGVQFVEGAYQAFSPLLDHFALVSFDPRGVGASEPVRCVTSSFLDRYLNEAPVPKGAAQVAAYAKQAKTFADDCYRRNGDYLEHVGTIDAARDMDVLRAALGDRQLSYYGASYGTYLGAKYAQLFPRRIGAMVLDGAVDPAQSTITADRLQAVGFETDLDDFVQACVTKGGCPLGATTAAVDADLRGLFRRVSEHPEPVGTRTLGPGNYLNGLADGFYDASDWPALQTALADVGNGDGAKLLAFADDLSERRPNGTYPNLVESNTAINCIDRPSPRSVSAYESAAAAAAKVAPFFGAAITWSSLPCAFWRVPPVEQAHPVHAPDAAATILVLGTTHDPATPYSQAVSLTRELGKAELVTRDGDGHTALFSFNPCIYRAVAAYLIDGTLPPQNTVCR